MFEARDIYKCSPNIAIYFSLSFEIRIGSHAEKRLTAINGAIQSITSNSLTPTAWSPHHPRRTSNHYKRRILERCHGIKGIVVLRTPKLTHLTIQPPVAPRTPSPTTDAPPVPRFHSHRRPPPFPRRLPAADPRAQKGNPSWSIVEVINLFFILSVCRVNSVEYPFGTPWIANVSSSLGMLGFPTELCRWLHQGHWHSYFARGRTFTSSTIYQGIMVQLSCPQARADWCCLAKDGESTRLPKTHFISRTHHCRDKCRNDEEEIFSHGQCPLIMLRWHAG